MINRFFRHKLLSSANSGVSVLLAVGKRAHVCTAMHVTHFFSCCRDRRLQSSSIFTQEAEESNSSNIIKYKNDMMMVVDNMVNKILIIITIII